MNLLLRHFEGVVTGVEAKLERARPGEPIGRKRLALEIARLGVRLFSGEERVAWCGVLAPFDLLNAMGVTSCFVEFVGAMLASTGTASSFLAEAELAGYAPDTCSYHRAVTGAAVQGMMPVPDFLVATSAPCVGGMAVIENLARHYDRDLFVLDVPSGRDRAAEQYLADQLRALTDFVAARTGEPLDRDRLRAAVDFSNRARELLLEVYELASRVPSPARPRDLVNFGIVVSLLMGTERAVEVARTYRDQFARTAGEGGGRASNERVRLMWLQNRIQFRNPLDQILDEQYGARIVIDELNDVDWEPLDPDDPYIGMARRLMSIPLTGAAAHRIENLARLARKYHVHGAINPCHWGCRQGTGARGLIEEALGAVGVPVLNLEVDCVDERNYADGQMRTRLEAFMEMIANNRASEDGAMSE